MLRTLAESVREIFRGEARVGVQEVHPSSVTLGCDRNSRGALLKWGVQRTGDGWRPWFYLPGVEGLRMLPQSCAMEREDAELVAARFADALGFHLEICDATLDRQKQREKEKGDVA